jgi:hypothetical protein
MRCSGSLDPAECTQLNQETGTEVCDLDNAGSIIDDLEAGYSRRIGYILTIKFSEQ